MKFLLIKWSFLSALLSASALASECTSSDEKTRLENVIEWSEFNCDETGECGVVIKVPYLIEDAKFEAIALVKRSHNRLEFLARLPTHRDEGYVTAIVSGTEKFLKNFSVRVLYNSSSACLSWSDRPLLKDTLDNEV